MKILYLSVHEVLEYDEVKLFTELGHEVYSHGAYLFPGGDANRKRPPIDGMAYDPQMTELMVRYGKDQLHPELLERVDMVMVMHEPSFIHDNLDVLRTFTEMGGRVVRRTIGQSTASQELALAETLLPIEHIRYSRREERIPHFMGAAATIPFYKDPDDFKLWNGTNRQVVNFTQRYMQRADHCGQPWIDGATRGLPFKVFGPDNEGLGDRTGGLLSYDALLDTLADNRAFIYHGTYPASYTLSFIEGWMAGIPMVCAAAGIGNAPPRMGYPADMYEIEDFITDGEEGFIVSPHAGAHNLLQTLLDDHVLADRVSRAGRAKAIELFGVDTVREQWRVYFDADID